MEKLMFKTALTPFKKGEKALYRGIVQNKGARQLSDLVRAVAKRLGIDEAIVRFSAELLFQQLVAELKDGYHVELEDFLSGGLSITGTFLGANAPWDRSKNSIRPYFNAKGAMREAFKDVEMVNVTEGNHVILKRVLDTTSKTEGVITNTPNVVVYLSGSSMLIDLTAEDEGVWLENAEGEIVATATVTNSTSTTVDCTFATLPEDGDYKIVIATRGGLGPEFGVSMAKKNITVKTANAN